MLQSEMASKNESKHKSVISAEMHEMISMINDSTNYTNIASHIDGGLLSSHTFLPFKQWIESSVHRYTESANDCLDQMKKESQMLESIHRKTVHSVYDDEMDMQSEEDTANRRQFGRYPRQNPKNVSDSATFEIHTPAVRHVLQPIIQRQERHLQHL